ncbi:MAG TPA: hypothetical protein VFJ86_17405 [Usitatibacter sp.]|jgi:hypothetical protein|nr:hypothetical protein [Usitatibacter sp.]
MYFQYPLETIARRRGLASQLEFATEARRHLPPDSDETMYEPHDHGLVILAADETALAAPTDILRDAYGDFVHVSNPKVRYLPGRPPHLPVMHVRITMPSRYELRVVAELRRRGVRIVERCERSGTFTVRAEAPLDDLLGLPTWLDRATEGTASHAIRLQCYAPSPLGPAA